VVLHPEGWCHWRVTEDHCLIEVLSGTAAVWTVSSAKVGGRPVITEGSGRLDGPAGHRTRPRNYETVLFLAILSGPPRLRERDPLASLSGVVDYAVLISALVWGLAAFWVFLNLGGYLLLRKSLPRFEPLVVLALLLGALLSLSALVSDAILLSLYRAIQILIAVMFGFFWVRRFGIDSTLRHLLAGVIAMGIAIGVCAVAAPGLVWVFGDGFVDFAEGARLRGDYIGPTGATAVIGLVLLLGYPTLLLRYPTLKRRVAYLFAVALLLTLFILARERAAYVTFALFVLLAYVSFPASRPLRLFLYSLPIGASIVIVAGWVAPLSAWVIREQDTVSTLSDRIPLWQFTASYVVENVFWFGYGLMANRTITLAYNEGLGTSHSAYLEIFSGGGMISFAVFMVLLVLELAVAIRLLTWFGRRPEVFVIVSLLLATIVFGLVSEITLIATPASFVFWVLPSLLSVANRTSRVGAQRGENGSDTETTASSQPLSTTRR
jgi:hypothetical protein